MRRGLGLALLMLLVVLASATPASAQACTDTAGTLPLAFGTYTGTLQTSVSTVTITCNGKTSYKVGLDAGLGIGATTSTRKMTGPAGATLNYQIFQDAARTLNWGNTSGVDTLTATGNGSAQPYSTYAQLAAGPLVAPGSYTDLVTASVTASGNTAGATFTVTATVLATCLVSATDMAFGTYTGAVVTSTSTLSVTCTNTTPYNIGLSAGLATGATVTTRKMTGPASATLGYALFSDAGRTINWGNTVGTDTVSSTGNGIAQLSSVFGRLAAGQLVTPGAYSDTIIVTVTY
jgi:spore coat protein U-like protein